MEISPRSWKTIRRGENVGMTYDKPAASYSFVLDAFGGVRCISVYYVSVSGRASHNIAWSDLISRFKQENTDFEVGVSIIIRLGPVGTKNSLFTKNKNNFRIYCKSYRCVTICIIIIMGCRYISIRVAKRIVIEVQI